ncbi:MAG: 2-amino-4-hydroxy-6-hydroxymethyldihydropteridine diphosphokinase [Candidatus Pacebacteria bacterium]|nr:2-amino-4-hydroxy-6-hydroxymethyldihydropteridine diphosphokinase [Candidatus Paceibacterota bacterium]
MATDRLAPLDWSVLPSDHALIALGSNLPSPIHGESRLVLDAALKRLGDYGIKVIAVGQYYQTEPDPPSDQPNYVNSAALVASPFTPRELLVRLHEIEAEFGRHRQVRNEARILDLDLLAFGAEVITPESESESELTLPHPRLHQRLFVLQPLNDILPHWFHPTRSKTIAEMMAHLQNR